MAIMPVSTETKTFTVTTTKLLVAVMLSIAAAGLAFVATPLYSSRARLTTPSSIGEESPSPTPQQRTQPLSTLACRDSDNGINPLQAGSTTLYQTATGAVVDSGTDYCLTTVASSTPAVREYYCATNAGQDPQAMVYADIPCLTNTICQQGACITNQNPSAPLAPIVTTQNSPTSLFVAIAPGDGNGASILYAIREKTTNQFVQADGSLKQSPSLDPFGAAVYKTMADWSAIEIKNLKVNTQYSFHVDAKSANNTHSGFGPETKRYTLALAPVVPTISNITSSSFNLTLGADNNPPWTTYVVHENKTPSEVQANGTLAANQAGVQKTAAEWSTTTIKNLASNTVYSLRIGAFNGDKVYSGASPDFIVATLGACAVVHVQDPIGYNDPYLSLDGAPLYHLGAISTANPATASSVQLVARLEITAASGPNCQPIEIKDISWHASSSFALGDMSIYLDSTSTSPLASGPIINNTFSFHQFFGKNGLQNKIIIQPGQTKYLLVYLNTAKAKSKDMLWIQHSGITKWKVGSNFITSYTEPPLPGIFFYY